MTTLDKESLFSKARQSAGFLMRVYFVAQNLYYICVGGYADLLIIGVTYGNATKFTSV